MTLEKLLIFGFALAVFTAIAYKATDISDTRDVQTDGYREKVDDLAEKAR